MKKRRGLGDIHWRTGILIHTGQGWICVHIILLRTLKMTSQPNEQTAGQRSRYVSLTDVPDSNPFQLSEYIEWFITQICPSSVSPLPNKISPDSGSAQQVRFSYGCTRFKSTPVVRIYCVVYYPNLPQSPPPPPSKKIAIFHSYQKQSVTWNRLHLVLPEHTWTFFPEKPLFII